ncbi:spermine/spermidine synthase, partial [Hortaea werneckii]
ERRANGWMVNEPIYSVFEMLEAVRLMEVDPPIRDSDAEALVVGLGIGTAPRSLMAHGINTTTLELDPKVSEYATKYFALPPGHTVITDAVSWVSQSSKEQSKKYDYILHDVFTGGVEPLSLFTNSFLSDLRNLLTPNGVVGLNYAGDLSTPLTNLVLNTIHGAFDGQCKIFRDAPPKDTTNDAESKEDFLNMLIFCRNTPGPITFRQPTSKDFLGS